MLLKIKLISFIEIEPGDLDAEDVRTKAIFEADKLAKTMPRTSVIDILDSDGRSYLEETKTN